MEPTKRLVAHVLNSRLDAIPEKARERAKLSILDTIATAIGGSGDVISRAARRYGELSGGIPESTVWVYGEKLSAGIATLVNATMARALDFDETYELYINGCHASAYDVPPALALAERDASITGSELLTAVTTGIDLHLRLARSITVNSLETGRDNMVAVWGAAAVGARLLRLDEPQTMNAFGIAYAQAAGEFQMYEETTHTVALQQGLRARSGLESALLASVGLNGPHAPFLGKFGFYRAFEPKHDLALLLDGLGEEYVNESISFKPWPACKIMHPGIYGMRQLRERYGFAGDDIDAIHVSLNSLAASVVIEPRSEKWNPKDAVAARFSLPYTIAVAAAKGTVGIGDMRQEAFEDPLVRRILASTKADVDEEIDRTHGLHQNSPTKLRVRLKSGAEHSIRVDKPFGHPDNPASLSDGAEKLYACAKMSALPFHDRQLQEICDFVAELEKQPTVKPLFELLGGDPSPRKARGPSVARTPRKKTGDQRPVTR